MLLRLLTLMWLALVCAAVRAAPLPASDVPEPLKPWIPWALHGEAARFCPPRHDDANQRLCHWPSQLELALDARGGRFELRAQTFAPGWLALPGDGPRWPQDVSVDTRRAPVLDRNGTPSLWLEPGTHRIQGRFDWTALPESLRVPPDSGLVALSLDGRAQAHPQRDAQHQLWLGKRASTADAQADRLSLRVFRRVDDDIPLRLTTQIELDVGGAVREAVIGPALLAGLVPLSLSGGLPARLDDDGRLRVQLRPGRWQLSLLARSTAPVAQLAARAADAPWPTQEIWSLQAHPELRVIEPSGPPAADPRQVGVPEGWQNLPAFLLEAGATLALNETQRGSPDLTPDTLHLNRQLWLDFDGRGYTVQDQLGGRLARTWRLDAQAPIALGRVQVDGEPQLITTHEGGSGVEVRHGVLNLVADSRIEDGARRLPASGWNTDLQEIHTTLHLPPAWRLIAAPGVDNVPDTWLARWTLLDLFLVLIAAIAALRLFGRGAAALTLLTLALTWHEPGAPRWAWLNLIAAIALLRALPATFDGSGRLRRLLWGYQWIAAGVLALVALPFAVQQARLALYPQLEMQNVYGGHTDAPGRAAMAPSAPPMMEDAAVMAEIEAGSAAESDGPRAQRLRPLAKAMVSSAVDSVANVSQRAIQKLDPNVLTQTGPGLPGWSWRQTELRWSGPVTAQQDFRLWLMPPLLTRALGWLSIALIALLALRWLSLTPRLPQPPRAGAPASLLASGLALLTLGLPAHDARAQALAPPTPELLEQLRDKLSAPPDCLPDCASWSRLELSVAGGERLLLRLTAEAQIDTALPLPVPPLADGQSRVWQAQTVQLDEADADLLRDARGALWLRVPAGRHAVLVSGELTGFSQLQLPVGPAPKQVKVQAEGWQVSGVDAEGRVGAAIDLVRERKAKSESESEHASVGDGSAQQALPPLLRLTRTVQLALVWGVESSLTRVGSAQGAYLASVPALPGEVVTGEAVRVVDGRLQASFAPGQREVRWTSRLDTTPQLALQASEASDLIETWRFDVSPLWHIGFEGLPAVSHQEGDWRLVTFRPWPGERVTAHVARPPALQGQVMTLDLAELSAQPAKRATDYALALRVRASQGGQHALPLPQDLTLQGLEIDGLAQPARVEGGRVILPLRPGEQTFNLKLRADQGLGLLTRTPVIEPGLPGVNARIHVQLPPDRWTLLVGGPALGPAVLFWGVLAVLIAVALALGRLGLTPLKGLQWALLMVGLSQVPIAGAALVAGWLFALALRPRLPSHWAAWRFNLAQVVLAIWTVAALGTLFGAVAQGLLGAPDMQIAGNFSHAQDLHWYQDRYAQQLPTAWVLSVSIWFYRGLMLLWALWLANSLLNWLRWGWMQYSAGGLWKKNPAMVASTSTAPTPGTTP